MIDPKNPRQKALDKSIEREKWLKLVVKVLTWKDNGTDKQTYKTAPKISTKEWSVYTKKVLSTNLTYGVEKVSRDLKELKKLIESRGGFE